MAIIRMTSAEARKHGRVDLTKLDATTEDDIRRHMIEDGEDADAPLAARYRVVILPAVLRANAGMSQTEMARALRIPVETWQAWEEAEWGLDPVVSSFLDLVADDPRRAFAALADRISTDASKEDPASPRLEPSLKA